MWMAEGLIHVSDADRSSSSSSIKERLIIAEEHLRDLVERKLVILKGNKEDNGTMNNSSCLLHKLIHEICMLKGKEEGFFELDGGKKISSYNQPEAKQVRSLFFSQNNSMEGHQELLEWTRVLDFDGVDFQGSKFNLKSIDKLLYLRYLGFGGCYLQALAMSFNNFIYLETLDLRVKKDTSMIIPNVLWKLLSLRYLYFPLSFQCDDKQNKLKLAGLSKLEIIENFHAGICDANELLQFEHLQILSGTADGNTKDFNDIIRVINGNKNLRQSSLILKNFDCYSQQRKNLLKQFMECNAIHGLQLEGHIKLSIPESLAISQNLTSMVLDGSEFKDQDQDHLLQVLGRAQQLRILVLCNDAIVGKKIVISSGFTELRKLKIANLQYLEKWVMGKEAMPNLYLLKIEQCNKLQMLPDEVMERVRLTKLKIRSMPKDFEHNVSKMVRKQLIKGKNMNVNYS